MKRICKGSVMKQLHIAIGCDQDLMDKYFQDDKSYTIIIDDKGNGKVFDENDNIVSDDAYPEKFKNLLYNEDKFKLDIKNIVINWNNLYSNDPEVHIEISKDNFNMLSHKIDDYEEKLTSDNHLIYYQENYKFIRGFVDNRSGAGFGGRSFNVILKSDPSVTISVQGPFITSATYYNRELKRTLTDAVLFESSTPNHIIQIHIEKVYLIELLKKFVSKDIQYVIDTDGVLYITKNQPINTEYDKGRKLPRLSYKPI